jgi:hypothetical protein
LVAVQFAADPGAYGLQPARLPRSMSAASTLSCSSSDTCGSGAADADYQYPALTARRRKTRPGPLRRVGSLLVVAGVAAAALQRSGSSRVLDEAGSPRASGQRFAEASHDTNEARRRHRHGRHGHSGGRRLSHSQSMPAM